VLGSFERGNEISDSLRGEKYLLVLEQVLVCIEDAAGWSQLIVLFFCMPYSSYC
jgi:hypothetical protein